MTALTKANLTNANDKIMVASEDSSALAAIKNLIPSTKLVYNVPYNPDNPISVTSPVLQVRALQADEFPLFSGLEEQTFRDLISRLGYSLIDRNWTSDSASFA